MKAFSPEKLQAGFSLVREADPEREWRPTYKYLFEGEEQGWGDLYLLGNFVDWDRFMPHDSSETIPESMGWGTLAYIETLLDVQKQLNIWTDAYINYSQNNVWDAGKGHLKRIGLEKALHQSVPLPIALDCCMNYASQKGLVFPEKQAIREAATELLQNEKSKRKY